MMKKYDLEEFQLSQSYLFFVDSLSKANYFLEQTLDIADKVRLFSLSTTSLLLRKLSTESIKASGR